MGQLVGAGTTTLATIVQLNPIYVNFNVSETGRAADPRRHGEARDDRRRI